MQYTIWGSLYILFAFSATTGALLGQTQLSGPPPELVSDSFWEALWELIESVGVSFTPGQAGAPPNYEISYLLLPQPGVAIFYNPEGGTPFIAATDGYEDIVVLTFDLNTGFTENLRRHDTNYVPHSQPAIMPDGHSVVGTGDGRLMFYGPNGISINDIMNLYPLFSSPCRTVDGTIITLGLQPEPAGSTMSVIKNNVLFSQTFLNPRAISAPAASFNHIFFNLASGLYTVDTTSLEFVAEYPWPLNYEGEGSGGITAPAIGPSGEVYAIANNTLYMWPGIRLYHPPPGERGTIPASHGPVKR